MSTISPGLVNENSSIGALFAFRKLSGFVLVSPIEFATFLPALAKNVLNSFVMMFGSSIDFPCTVSLQIFEFLGS